MTATKAPEHLPEDPRESLRPTVIGGVLLPGMDALETFRITNINDMQTIVELPGQTDQQTIVEPRGETAMQTQAFAPARADLKADAVADTVGQPQDATGTHDRADDARFKLISIIGQGGFGEVWEATQASLGRSVAVKRLKASIYRGKDQRTTEAFDMHFRNEALVHGRLDHPNIVPVHDLYFDRDGHPMLAMKLVNGTPWSEIIDADLEEAPASRLTKHVRILVSVTQAVSFAHSRGVLHRDLKPSQVIVGEFGEVYLMDWGLAVAFGEPGFFGPVSADVFGIKPADIPNPAGTVAFMAPEQTETTSDRIGPWTDVFLLGGILYYILTGTSPHSQDSSTDAWDHAVIGIVDSPETRAPNIQIPKPLSRLCMQAMAREPEQRISVMQFANALEAWSSGANRIEESRMLVTQAEGILASANINNYQELSVADNLIRRALFLWPENPDAGNLEQTLLHIFAQTALDNGDYCLTAFLAARMESAKTRKAYVNTAARQRNNMRTMGIQRTVAALLLALIVLSAVAVVSGGYALGYRIEIKPPASAQPAQPAPQEGDVEE